MDQTSVFAPIFKSQEQDDGTLLIYGKATGSDLDLDQQRCDPNWLERAMPKWFGTGAIGDVGGNIREQHDNKRAVGKATEYEAKSDGHYIKARIVDPVAIAKTKAGVFTGLSIGISRPRLDKEWIRAGDICEVSLCDRPCLPTATFTMCKAAKPGMEVSGADLDEERGLVKCAELSVDKEQVAAELADGKMTLNKARATLGLAEFDSEQADKFVKPSPLNMPGAKKSVSLDSQPLEEAVADQVEKATDTGHLEAPAPGQTCTDCGEDGHLNCGPTDAVKEFDREAAKALVEQITKAAGDVLGQDESGDISGAEQVISQLAQLIVSEAQALADMPSQDCDIYLLMSAVDAVRIFSAREKLEQGAIDPDSMVMLSADAEVTKAKYTADELKQMLKDGKAFKNTNGEPSYPIADKDDLAKAIKAVGRGSGDHNSIRAYIQKRAKALGASDMIPDDWSNDGSNKGADTEPVETPESTTTVDTEVEKTADPETTKAVLDEGALGKAVSAALEKLFSSDELEKEDNPIRKTLGAIEASTKTIAETLEAQGERLVKVESMATPGGPALRRTDTEVKKSRQQDLELLARAEERKAAHTHDNDLRQGYLSKAMGLRTEAKALQN